MTKLRLMISVCFFAAFGAGLLAGIVWERSNVVATNEGNNPRELTDKIIPAPVNSLNGQQPIPPNPDFQKPVVSDPNQTPKPPVLPRRQDGPPMFDNGFWLRDLKLTTEQNEKMGKIWGNVMTVSRELRGSRRDQVRKEKEDAIDALFTNEKQREDYYKILADAEKKYDDLNKENQSIQDSAVAATRELLTEDQRKKYDELRKKRDQQWHRGPGPGPRPDGKGPSGHDGREGHRPGGDKPPQDKAPVQ